MGKSNREVKYRIIIRRENQYYFVGYFRITRFEGDLLYAPSQKLIVESSFGEEGKIADHFSWHKSGRVHVKLSDGYKIFEVGAEEDGKGGDSAPRRQAIVEVGFQELIRDTIIDFTRLPAISGAMNPLDVVLDVQGYSGPVQFLIHILSRRLMIKKLQGKTIPLKLSPPDVVRNIVLASDRRALSHESGNADKLLTYLLVKYTGEEINTWRRIFVTRDSKIHREFGD